jgi:hypothetical protein
MNKQVISADRDDNSSSLWDQETATRGERRNTEVWHIPRQLEPNKPLCGARLSGRFKRTKGLPNCARCKNNASLKRVYSHHHPVFRALLLNQPIPPYPERYQDHSSLYEGDLVGDKGGRMVLTARGLTVARDIIDPVGWLDARTHLFHARRALELTTLCGLDCGGGSTRLDAFEELHRQARKLGRTTITCVHCVVIPRQHAYVE